MMLKKILIVCVGNVCRSPMAAAMLKQQQPTLTIASAGLNALVGEPADTHAIAVMDEVNIDVRAHRAQQLTDNLMQQFDLVLCMSKEQASWIKQHWPMHRGKVYRLGHWINQDIKDPYQAPIEVFTQVRDLIHQATDSWHDELSSRQPEASDIAI